MFLFQRGGEAVCMLRHILTGSAIRGKDDVGFVTKLSTVGIHWQFFVTFDNLNYMYS